MSNDKNNNTSNNVLGNNTLMIIGLFLILIMVLIPKPQIGISTFDDNATLKTNITNDLLITQDLWDECVNLKFGDKCFVVHKFGENSAIGTTLGAVTGTGSYPTPTTLTSLEILSSSALDTSTGIGARSVTVQGISTNWTQITETVIMNGTTPVQLSNQFYRVYRMIVLESGTYATESLSSHVGIISIRESGGGTTWQIISNSPIPLGQSEIGVYTVPSGYKAHIGNIVVGVEGNKAADIFLLRRENSSNVIAPYNARRVLQQFKQVQGIEILVSKANINSLMETADVGFMAKTITGTTSVSVNYDILLIKTS